MIVINNAIKRLRSIIFRQVIATLALTGNLNQLCVTLDTHIRDVLGQVASTTAEVEANIELLLDVEDAVG